MNTSTYTPRLVFWELTEGCNLKCQHCRATAQPTRSPDELSTEAAFAVVDQIADLGNPVLILTGGEPLYRHDVFDIATYAKSKGLHIALATNGTLVDASMAERIREAGFERVSISFDGASAEVHDGFRGIPGAFDAALKGVRNLQAAGVPVQFNTTITKHNAHQRNEMFRFAKDTGAVALHLFMLVPVGCGLEIQDNQMLDANEYEEMLTWFYDASSAEGLELRATCAPHYYRIMRQRAKQKGERVPVTHGRMSAVTKGCLAGTGVFFISRKGIVQPCGYLPLAAGDVKTQPLRDIWNDSELFASLRNTGNLQGKCGHCEFINVCSGCRARAYAATGDYLQAEPYCAYEPRMEHRREGSPS